MLLALSVMMLVQGISGTRLALVAGLNLAVGGIVATLWWSERRLARAPLDRSVRQVLEDLLTRVESAGRAYEIAYVGFIACAIAAIGLTVWSQTESGLWLTSIVLGGALAIVWARRSGRAYVKRMFGPYRAELADCLRELDRS
jgi:hypothetical protein